MQTNPKVRLGFDDATLATFIVERSIINTVTGGFVLSARPSATQHPTPFAHGFLADSSK